ncbi:MAG: efflux RND transporter permease subunit [Methyloligellaceae bacterium]
MGVGLGIERIGYLCLRLPYVAAALIIAVSVFAGMGISRIDVDDSLSELFRADTKEFNTYELMSSRFPSSEFDVLAVIEGDLLGSPKTLNALRELALELNFVALSEAPEAGTKTEEPPGFGDETEVAKGVISFFSARRPPNQDGYPPPLVPADLPTGEKFLELKQEILQNEIVKGKLLSNDGKLGLIVIALDRKVIKKFGLKKAINALKKTITTQLKDTGLDVKLSGAPVMQLEIRNAVQADRIIYNGLGFILGGIICFLFFRRLEFMLITVAAPGAAILWSLGTLGLLDFRLNLFLNVITPLIMVISFADAMHMVFAIRRRMLRGDTKAKAIHHAISQVGPACVLTSVTTAIALFSLYFTQSALIKTFAIVGALSAITAFLAVIIVVPTVAALILRDGEDFAEEAQRTDAAMQKLSVISDRIGIHVLNRPYTYTILGVVLVVVFGAAHLSLSPRYQLIDQVPDQEQAVAASNRLDKKLTGAKPLHVMIEFKKGQSLYAPETLEVIRVAHETLEGQKGVGNVWSVEMLRRWLAKSGIQDVEVLKGYVKQIPKHLVQRFVTDDQRSIIITGRVADIDASDLLPVVDAIEKKLDAVRAKYPDYEISVTGLASVSARYSKDMITQLNYGLITTVFVVVILMAIIFNSLMIGIVSFIPNIFPIFTAGVALYLSGNGLQFASVVALTVAFGLAVDDTIHYLHRMQLEDERAREENINNLARTMDVIGPVIILTTIVLILGLSVTVFSGLPSLRLFGWLNAVTLFAALIAVLVLLPACVATIRKLRARPLKPKSSFLDLF